MLIAGSRAKTAVVEPRERGCGGDGPFVGVWGLVPRTPESTRTSEAGMRPPEILLIVERCGVCVEMIPPMASTRSPSGRGDAGDRDAAGSNLGLGHRLGERHVRRRLRLYTHPLGFYTTISRLLLPV